MSVCGALSFLPLLNVCKIIQLEELYFIYENEPVREKTNNFGSDQVRHKPGCTVTEDG